MVQCKFYSNLVSRILKVVKEQICVPHPWQLKYWTQNCDDCDCHHQHNHQHDHDNNNNYDNLYGATMAPHKTFKWSKH